MKPEQKSNYSFVKMMILLMILFAGINSGFSQKGNDELAKKRITLVNQEFEKVVINAEIAVSESEHTYGLMYRKSLGDNEGMLFVFEQDGYRNFWMKNTIIPLSIAYINAKGVIMEIYEMKPLDVSITYPSKYPCRYALEMSAGWFRKNNIRPGSVMLIEGIK
jgi:uncharacterized membrane protein (UPF0127 family)